MAFDLDQAVDNATARVVRAIRFVTDDHHVAIAWKATYMHAAWRNRHLLMQRDLRGIAFPVQHIDPRCALPFIHHTTFKD